MRSKNYSCHGKAIYTLLILLNALVTVDGPNFKTMHLPCMLSDAFPNLLVATSRDLPDLVIKSTPTILYEKAVKNYVFYTIRYSPLREYKIHFVDKRLPKVIR